jgi:hypothetical protein
VPRSGATAWYIDCQTKPVTDFSRESVRGRSFQDPHISAPDGAATFAKTPEGQVTNAHSSATSAPQTGGEFHRSARSHKTTLFWNARAGELGSCQAATRISHRTSADASPNNAPATMCSREFAFRTVAGCNGEIGALERPRNRRLLNWVRRSTRRPAISRIVFSGPSPACLEDRPVVPLPKDVRSRPAVRRSTPARQEKSQLGKLRFVTPVDVTVRLSTT